MFALNFGGGGMSASARSLREGEWKPSYIRMTHMSRLIVGITADTTIPAVPFLRHEQDQRRHYRPTPPRKRRRFSSCIASAFASLQYKEEVAVVRLSIGAIGTRTVAMAEGLPRRSTMELRGNLWTKRLPAERAPRPKALP